MPDRTQPPATATPPAPAAAGEQGCRVKIMGAQVASMTEAEAVQTIVSAAAEGRGHWTVTANLDHIRRYRCEPLARRLIDSADLVLADGTPLIWASRLAGQTMPERVAGSDMVWSISEMAGHEGMSVFLLGGDPGVAERAAAILSARCPGLRIAGTACPAVGFERDAQELERIRAALAQSAPQIVFVALGFPKQDLLIADLRDLLPHTAFIGVGISLSFITGDVPRAPRWTHPLGLEWVHRLMQEPRRLMHRYLAQGVPFAVRMLASAALHRARRDRRAGWGPAGASAEE